MTMDQAETIARELYASHPAAVPLLMEAVNGTSNERRRRSARALLAIDPDAPAPRLQRRAAPRTTPAPTTWPAQPGNRAQAGARTGRVEPLQLPIKQAFNAADQSLTAKG